jgi:hypothetical protein
MGRLEEQLGAIVDAVEYEAWRRVPDMVVALYKKAAPAACRLAAWATRAAGPEDQLWWHPDTRTAWAHVADIEKRADWEALPDVPDVPGVALYVEPIAPPPVEGWVLVKAANGYLAPLARPGFALQHLIGGKHPTGLHAAIVNSLIGGGLGYGTGWLAEKFLPEEYAERGHLPITLGLAGAGLGAAPGLWQWTAQRRAKGLGAFPGMQGTRHPLMGPEATGAPGTPGTPLPPLPKHEVSYQDLEEEMGPPVLPGLKRASVLDPLEPRINPWFRKAAQDFGQTGALFMRSIPVDAFNQVIWNDVRNPANAFGTKSPWGTNEQPMYTPPYAAAATAGLLSGTAAATQSNEVSPFEVATSAAIGAGKGWLTGMAAGKILGALAGLKPEAQEKLQSLGVWGGLITGVANSLFR